MLFHPFNCLISFAFTLILLLQNLECISNLIGEFTHQSNNLEYIVFAKASLLVTAAAGSSGFVMLPSGVTMTRLQRESSRAFSLHLYKCISNNIQEHYHKAQMSYQVPKLMRSLTAIAQPLFEGDKATYHFSA